MKWRKLGKLFDPTEHALPNSCREFAQAPQALVFPEFVRVYFSTRELDATGMFLSHVAFVDFCTDLSAIVRVSPRAVLPLGGLGCFDEHGIFPMNVLRRGDSIHAYTTGWSRRVSVPVETAIGLAVSRDEGMTFERVGQGPVLAASLHEPFLVGDAFVLGAEARLHMWYIFGIAWKRYSDSGPVERTYKIGHATSQDGVDWVTEGGRQIVQDRLGPQECQALPTVMKLDSRYHMFFCFREAVGFREVPDRGYHIGHAWSDDLESWTRNDDQLAIIGTPGTWDGDMQCYPHVFATHGRTYLLYNGNEFGRLGFGAAVLEP